MTSVDLPFGTSGSYFTSSITSGDAFSLWGYAGAEPLVGVSSGYTSGSPISASMVLSGETIAGMTLIPGTYVFAIPDDTITLVISASATVPEPAIWAMMLMGVGGIGAAMRSSRRRQFASPTAAA